VGGRSGEGDYLAQRWCHSGQGEADNARGRRAVGLDEIGRCGRRGHGGACSSVGARSAGVVDRATVPARSWGRETWALGGGRGGGGWERGHPGVDTFHALLGLFVCVGLMGQNDF
jgi:hypothetical protein